MTFIPLAPLDRIGRGFVGSLKALSERILFERRLKRIAPVFVYQMGKVASSSVYYSLLKQYPGAVAHAHAFGATHAEWRIRRLYQWARVRKKPLKVISMTREPMSRNISAFFQNFERDTGVSYEKSTFSLQELKDIYLANYPHETPLEWFDKNIDSHFQIDVYATTFPDCGFATYERENVSLLVMRSEISDEEKVGRIKEFLEIGKFRLETANVGEGKEYAETYKRFRAEVTFPPEFVAGFCESRYFGHFYGAEAIEATRARWTEPQQT